MASEVLYVLPLTRSDERRGLAFIKFTRPVKKISFVCEFGTILEVFCV